MLCLSRALIRSAIVAAYLLPKVSAAQRNLIIDTDIYSDCDDTGALLLAAASSDVNILGVNINAQSSYSSLAASAILAHYGHPAVPIGARRPLTNESFFDAFYYSLGEFTSKVAYHYPGGTLTWGRAEDALDPVKLYRQLLASADDGSVTIASIGFLANLSGLLNATSPDEYSSLSGEELLRAKVSELVIMGGSYPSGREFNFFGDDPAHTAHVVNSLSAPGSPKVVYSGSAVGENVMSGMPLMEKGPASDPVRAAYSYYTHRLTARMSWDPLTMMYAIHGLGDLFEFANDDGGYNRVNATDGSNEWVDDASVTNQRWLKLKVSNETAAAELDRLYLEGAIRFAGNDSSTAPLTRRSRLDL
ncbi:hypothetical protein MCOR25_009177 [Pyricularia grisea]|uniref:Rhodanese domain-containing protein n=1 Tax=Pyricularia grisea TaxID=148305 RepID=A0A6P8ANJ0_PYRGI|nr:uncharacterized protein PgNI_11773 [Pyricularia grisea]KAI6353095.1 hypothetical protein MCOR25_009177 [Pyricularia grisea]TLD03598.1 hypothetical protein PgNI_11773 [Pyricularia grisea]